MWNVIAGLGAKTISYSYNSQDQITFVYYGADEDYKRFRNRYDFAGRLEFVDHFTDSAESDNPIYYFNLLKYAYNPNSQIETQSFENNTASNSYSYNKRSWIASMNSNESVLSYENSYFKNGNVKTQVLSGTYLGNFADKSDLNFEYTYDKSNRLLKSDFTTSEGTSFDFINTYDKDGNILTLDRYGSNDNLKDDFTYQYYSGTNKLKKVSGSADQYNYDANGNMKTDSLENNYFLKYDYRNLLTEIYHYIATSTSKTTYATRY